MSRVTAGAKLTLPESALITVSITMEIGTARLIHRQIRGGEPNRYEAAQVLNAFADAVALATKSWDAEQELTK